MPKLQKFTGEHQQFTISPGETQITNTHWGGRKSKPCSPGTDFIGLILTEELSGVDSAGLLMQGAKNILFTLYLIYYSKIYKHIWPYITYL